jgi:hypothetical protein
MAWRISAGLASTIILASTFAHADSLEPISKLRAGVDPL